MVIGPTGASPRRKATKAEVARRQELACQLWDQGHGVTNIEKILNISRQAIRVDLAKTGRDLDAPRLRNLAVSETIEWREVMPGRPKRRTSRHKSVLLTPPSGTAPSPAYTTSHVILDFRTFVEAFEQENYSGILAHNLQEALIHKDSAWEKEISDLLITTQNAVADLIRVMQDEDYRKYRMKGNNHRDTNYGRPTLRAVKDTG